MITAEAKQKIASISLDVVWALEAVDKFFLYADAFCREVQSVIPDAAKESFNYEESLSLLTELLLPKVETIEAVIPTGTVLMFYQLGKTWEDLNYPAGFSRGMLTEAEVEMLNDSVKNST